MRKLVLLICLSALFLIPLLSYASDDYIGERECFACHKQIKQVFLESKHGRVFTEVPKNELEKRGCEACHGPGSAHKEAVDREEKDLKIESFKNRSSISSEKNKICLACHENGKVTAFWQGSTHDMSGVSCITCHDIHSPRMTAGMDVCFRCHKERRAQLQRSSHMPLREGKITCMNCHNPHGGNGPKLLKNSSVNETCYACHAEKRGPVLWEHAPVRENCANCHDPHGSNYESLLKIKVPYLCQNCHDVTYHPSTLYDGTKLPGGSPAQQLLGKGCLNCHSLIHGSNHPSGARLQR